MPIRFQCNACGKSYQVAKHLAGESVNCTACEAVMVVPAEETLEEEGVDVSSLGDSTPSGIDHVIAPRQRVMAPPPKPAPAPPASTRFESDWIAPPAPPRPSPLASLDPPELPSMEMLEERPKPTPAPKVELPSRWKRSSFPRLALSDSAAKMLSGLLVLAMLIGGVWVGYRLTQLMTESGRVPEGLQSRFHVFLVLFALREIVFFFLLIAPTILVACALACNWTEWALPEGAYLRAAGTAALPYLLIFGVAMLAVRRELATLAALVVVTPLLIVIALKELMGLKWTTTLVAALLLLVFLPVEGLIRSAFNRQLNQATLSLARLDAESLKQWAEENPENARAARQARAMSESMPFARVEGGPPPPQARVANPQASTDGSSTPPDNLLIAIESVPLPLPKTDPAAFTADEFAFKTVRVRPLRTSKIDLAAYNERDTLQRWLLRDRDGVTLELGVEPLRDPKQQRPWVVDRPAVRETAEQKNLFAIVMEKAELWHGLSGDLSWTRAVKRDGFGNVTEAVYAARLPDAWLVARLQTRRSDSENVIAADKSIQGIRLATPGEAGADPYEPSRVVERFSDTWDDPSAIIRAAGSKGVEALLAYSAQSGGKPPYRAQRLLDEMTGMSGTSPRERMVATAPADVGSILATLSSSRSVFEKRDALQRLAGLQPDHRRDEVAAALEIILTGRDASFLAQDAGNALAVWWRPQTATAIVPLLDENVFPSSKRDAAIKVLAKTGDQRAVLPMVRWIIKAPEQVVAALTEMGPVAEAEVIPLLRYPQGAVRGNAARILSTIGTQKSLIELRRAANDPRDPLAAAAAKGALDVVLERVKESRKTAATTRSTP